MTNFESCSRAIQCQGQLLLLHPKGVIYWPEDHILFAADVHVGKEHRFGRAGIPIPGGISEATLVSLFSLAEEAGAKRLIILGDFMHSAPLSSESWLDELSRLLDSNANLAVEVVAGNHDKLSGQTIIDSRVTWHQTSLTIDPFVLKHEPYKDDNGFVLCGHVHPAWRLKQSRRASLKTPAFWFTKDYAVLPAFGHFTGGVVVDANLKEDSIYMIGENSVVKVPLDRTHPKRQTKA